MTIDKHLARFSQACERLNADHWRLSLANGHALTVSVRRDDDFVLLDADTGSNVAAAQLPALLARSHELPETVKYARCGSASTLRLRAEFPLPEESGMAAERIGGQLKALQTAFDRFDVWSSCEAAAEEMACPETEAQGQVIGGSLTELLKESGWQYHERSASELLVDLETDGQFLQAELVMHGAGTRMRVTTCRQDAAVAAWQPLCLYLLEANAALRYVRGFLQREADEITAGFEVWLGSEATPAEAGHALAALSVAARQCAREMEVLTDAAVAAMYRSSRPSPDDRPKGA